MKYLIKKVYCDGVFKGVRVLSDFCESEVKSPNLDRATKYRGDDIQIQVWFIFGLGNFFSIELFEIKIERF